MISIKIFTGENKRIEFGYELKVDNRLEAEILARVLIIIADKLWPKPKEVK